MKNAANCIKCAHDVSWRVDPLSMPERESANVIQAVPVACRVVENEEYGLFARPTRRMSVGAFVAYTCASCGYTELYARDIEEIGKLIKGEEGSVVTRVVSDET